MVVIVGVQLLLLLAGATAGESFYYFDGRQVRLEPEPNYIVVELDGSAAKGVAREAPALGPSLEVVPKFSRPSKGRWLYRVTGAAASEKSSSAEAVARATAARPGMVAGEARDVSRTYPVFRNPRNGLLVLHYDEVSVRVREGADEDEVAEILAALGLDVVRRDRFEPAVWLLRAPRAAGDEIMGLANRLARDRAHFVWAEPNFYPELKKYFLPNDAFFSDQWHLHNTGQNGGVVDADVDAEHAWDETRGSPSIVIAIIDDGLDKVHEDLAANLWTNPGEALDGTDTDGNGYVDDVSGWDFFDNDNDVQHYDQVTSEGHGTSCAGIAVAVGNNGKGVSGIAPNCLFFSCKIFRGNDDAGADSIAEAVRYATQFADVLSNSWGGGPASSNLYDAFAYARTVGRGGKGCVVVAASGNDYEAQVTYPAAHPWLMAVGATNRQDERFGYSNYGPGLDLVSPSGNWTTDITGIGSGYDGGDPAGNYTGGFGGTSSATPLVAGTVALLLSKNPALTHGQVAAILHQTADKIQSSMANYDDVGYSLEYGYGRLNAAAALASTPASGNNVDDHLEENDSRATARLLGASTHLKGLVALDEDWYRLEAGTGPGETEVIASLAFIHEHHNLELELYDGAGVLLESSVSTSDTERVATLVADEPGTQTFYLRVYESSATYGGYGYVLVTAALPPDDEYEDNDSILAPAAIDFGQYPDLRAYDDDFYWVSVTPGQGIDVRVTFDHDQGDIDMAVYDQFRDLIRRSESTTDTERIIVYGAQNRTSFLIHVYVWDNRNSSYSMDLQPNPDEMPTEDEFEENDSFADAAAIGPGEYPELACLDDDYYLVPVIEGAGIEVSFEFTHELGDLDVFLYDAAGVEVDRSTSGDDDEFMSSPGIPGNGAFVIKVEGWRGAINTYTMTVQLTDLPQIDGSASYFADGETREDVQTYILALNLDAAKTATLEFTLFFEDREPVTIYRAVDPASRYTFRLHHELPGLGLAPTVFGVRLRSNLDVYAERAMYWAIEGVFRTAATAAAGAREPLTEWLLAEGTTTRGRETTIQILNPNDEHATVMVTYLIEDGPPITLPYSVPARRRLTIQASADVPNSNFSVRVSATNDVPVVVDRTMFGPADGLPAQWGHATLASPAPALEWHLAEGRLATPFETFILLANISDIDAPVTLRFLPTTGQPVSRRVAVAANGRLTINVGLEYPELLAGGPFGTADFLSGFGTEILASEPIVVERAMYWRAGDFVERSGASCAVGLTQAGPSWFLAEGAVFGWSDFECDIVIGNPGDTAAEVEVIFLGHQGELAAPVSRTLSIGPGNRATVNANDLLESVHPDNRTISFSTIVRATNDVEIVVERSLYATTLAEDGRIPRYSGHASPAVPVSEAEVTSLFESLAGRPVQP
ncbi:DUF5719 family protein [Candidatus Sumerlaeota bacterium]